MTQPPTGSAPNLDLHDLKRLALDAEVDLRTLKRAISCHPVQPSSLHRIRRVLAERGLLGLLPPVVALSDLQDRGQGPATP